MQVERWRSLGRSLCWWSRELASVCVDPSTSVEHVCVLGCGWMNGVGSGYGAMSLWRWAGSWEYVYDVRRAVGS